jgi:uncharacterized protein (TIGR02996 family)
MTHEAFLQAIREAPDDDTHRLVYADWLQDQGDEARAEFIRSQVAYARVGYFTPATRALYARQKELLEGHQEEWLGPLARIQDPAVDPENRWTFKRGFVEGVKLSPRYFLKHIDEIVQAVPLQRITFANLGRSLRSVLKSPALANIPEWAFIDQKLGPSGWRRLGQCQHLPLVRSLFLGGSDLTADHARILATAVDPSFLTGVRYLNLAWTPVGDEGIGSLAHCDGLANLSGLSLVGAAVGPGGLMRLGRSPILTNLRSLSIGSRWITTDAARALVNNAQPPRLTELDLDLGEIRSAGLTTLAEAPSLANLIILNVVDNQIGPTGVEALSRSQYLTRLRRLDLSSNRIGTRGAEALAASPLLAGLVYLNVGYCRITPAGIRALARSPHVANLEHLELGENTIGPEGAQALVDAPHLRKLRVLDLTNTPLRKRDVAALRERYGTALHVSEKQ